MWALDYFCIEIKIAKHIDPDSGQIIPYTEEEIEVYTESEKDEVINKYIYHPALISINLHRCDRYQK